jgi:hypothetical protein
MTTVVFWGVLVVDEGGEGFGAGGAAALDLHGVAARMQDESGIVDGLGDDAGSDDGDDLGVLPGQVLHSHARDGTGAGGRKQIGAHDGQRGARIGVIEGEEVDGARQALLAILGVGAYHFTPVVLKHLPR